jgi:hypothetical protein
LKNHVFNGSHQFYYDYYQSCSYCNDHSDKRYSFYYNPDVVSTPYCSKKCLIEDVKGLNYFTDFIDEWEKSGGRKKYLAIKKKEKEEGARKADSFQKTIGR